MRGGRGARRVTQDRGHDRRRRVALEHRDRQRAAQRVQAVRAPGREHDPGAPRVIAQPAPHRRGRPERGERVAVFDEHLPAGRLRPAVPDVIDHRPSDVARQRQRQRQPGLVLRQRQRLGAPVEPSELQPAQIPDPHTEPDGQQHHRVIAFPDRGLPIDLLQHPTDLLSRPRVRGRLAASGIALRREPPRQVLPDLPDLVQVAQEVSQPRTQQPGRLRGVPPPLTPSPKPGQVPGLRLLDGLPTDLLEVGEELLRSPLLGHDGRFRVPPPPARPQVLVPDRTETRRTALHRRRCRLPHHRDASSQRFHQQDQRPACELSPSATGRLAQTREPAPGPLGDEIETVHLGRDRPAASLEKPGERIELRLVTLDRRPRPTRRLQRDDHPPRRVADHCCLHENRLPDRGEQERDSSPRSRRQRAASHVMWPEPKPRDRPSKGNTPAGHITQPST